MEIRKAGKASDSPITSATVAVTVIVKIIPMTVSTINMIFPQLSMISASVQSSEETLSVFMQSSGVWGSVFWILL